jgi:peptide/nickel transport system permease protein
MIVAIMSFIGWAGFARVIRGMSAAVRSVPYVEAARALGASRWRIITRHIIPSIIGYAIVAATLSIPGYILGESALSLLGLGIQEPAASWGNLLAAAQDIQNLEHYPWILIPGIFIFLTVMSFNFLGDHLRDRLDPANVR